MKNFNIIIDNENLLDFKYSLFLPENNSVKYCKIEDITDYENFHLLIAQLDFYNECFYKDGIHKNEIVYFSEKIKKAITNNKLKILFFSPHESPWDLEEFVYKLQNIIKKNNWKESQFYIVDNNSFIYKIKEKTNSKINFYKSNALLRMVGTQMKIKPSEKDIIFDKKFIFLCLNRGPNKHRISLLTYLKNSKLLENDITDWSWVIPPVQYSTNALGAKIIVPYSTNTSTKIQSIHHIKKYIGINNKSLINDYIDLIKEKKLSFYEQNVEYFDKIEYYKQTDHLVLDSYTNSYINIVTETNFEVALLHLMHITEKSFKPFYYFQLPIFVASYQHVKTMREEYDFYFFDDLIDHSYDNEIDDVKRFHMIVNEIKRLSNMREEIALYYKNNIDKLLHNHNFIKEYSKKQIEETYFLNLINENK